MAALVRDLLLDWLAQAQSRPKPVPRPAATVELGRVKRAEELLHARAEEAVSIA